MSKYSNEFKLKVIEFKSNRILSKRKIWRKICC